MFWKYPIHCMGWYVVQKQLLVGHSNIFAAQNSTKLHTTMFQHVLNHIVNFQCKWTTNVEWQLLKNCVSKNPISWISAILDVYSMHSKWHTAVDKLVPSLSMVANCHYYHCKYNLNRCNNIQQTGLAQKEMAVLVFIWLKQDFRRVFPKRIGEIVNFCRNNQAVKVFTSKRRYLYVFFKENVFEACL